MAAIQLSQALTALDNILKDLSDIPTSVRLQWCQTVSDFCYRIVSDIDPGRFIQSSTVSVSANVSSYALPSDFKNIEEFGTGLYVQQSNGTNLDQQLGMSGFGSQSQGFYIDGSNIVLTPTPQASAVRVLRYIPQGPVFTALTDYFTLDKLSTGAQIIPGEFLQYVQNALNVLYQIRDEMPGDEAYADARFVRTLDELARNFSRSPLVFSLPDFSSSF